MFLSDQPRHHLPLTATMFRIGHQGEDLGNADTIDDAGRSSRAGPRAATTWTRSGPSRFRRRTPAGSEAG